MVYSRRSRHVATLYGNSEAGEWDEIVSDMEAMRRNHHNVLQGIHHHHNDNINHSKDNNDSIDRPSPLPTYRSNPLIMSHNRNNNNNNNNNRTNKSSSRYHRNSNITTGSNHQPKSNSNHSQEATATTIADAAASHNHDHQNNDQTIDHTGDLTRLFDLSTSNIFDDFNASNSGHSFGSMNSSQHSTNSATSSSINPFANGRHVDPEKMKNIYPPILQRRRRDDNDNHNNSSNQHNNHHHHDKNNMGDPQIIYRDNDSSAILDFDPNSDIGDTYIDDLYQQYKMSVAISSYAKRVTRYRRWKMRGIIFMVILIVMIVIIHRRRIRERRILIPPTSAPVTFIPTIWRRDDNAPTALPTKYEVMVPVRDMVHLNQSYLVHERAATQISHYIAGTGLIVNIHITHQAGLTFCGGIGNSPSATGKAPSYVCLKPQAPTDRVSPNYPQSYPWTAVETPGNIAVIRQYFHMVNWEFRTAPTNPPLQDTAWENPNLISVLIIRHPLNRMLSGDAIMSKTYPNIFVYRNATIDDWWNFAQSDYTDNYALRILAGKNPHPMNKTDRWCCSGSLTNPIFYQQAKEIIRRFTFVLDVDCLQDGMRAIANILNLAKLGKYRLGGNKYPNLTIEQRINHTEIYQYLLQRNYYDIQLYEWAKRYRALIQCPTNAIDPDAA